MTRPFWLVASLVGYAVHELLDRVYPPGPWPLYDGRD